MKTLSVQTKESCSQKEYFGCENDIKYAGIHLLIEIWQAKHLTDLSKIREILLKVVDACGVTLLNIDLHVFSPNDGISGIAVLKESHISIHTWPEFHYAAVDIFVCGSVNPRSAVSVLEKEFKPTKMEVQEIKRGILP
ncbi:MAG: adenosylmethionine decarboxylase [Deltaproteobacteria bacterium]|nr:adenosylmethionine decarboxylase [Deltaproteobacteria bacterium]